MDDETNEKEEERGNKMKKTRRRVFFSHQRARDEIKSIKTMTTMI